MSYKFVLYFLLISIHQMMNAQWIPNPVNITNMVSIDSSNIRVCYALNAVDIKDSRTYDDYQRLEIGTYFSKYYSFFVYNSDSLVADWRKKNPTAQVAPRRLGTNGKMENWSEYHYSEYYKDFSKNTFTEYARMPLYLERFKYKYVEDIPVQHWAIHEDTTLIVGRICQKATCKFRGRAYTAWFALDIPINNGPWKFGGLPGLILKVYDDDRLCVFECISIYFSKTKYPIKKYSSYENYTIVERTKLLNLQKEIHENYKKIAGIETVGKPTVYERVSYDPLELE